MTARLRWSLNHRRVILALFVASLVASVGAVLRSCRRTSCPADDTGRLHGQIQAANGTSFDQMCDYTRRRSRAIINADPNVEGVFGQMDGRQRQRRHQ